MDCHKQHTEGRQPHPQMILLSKAACDYAKATPMNHFAPKDPYDSVEKSKAE